MSVRNGNVVDNLLTEFLRGKGWYALLRKKEEDSNTWLGRQSTFEADPSISLPTTHNAYCNSQGYHLDLVQYTALWMTKGCFRVYARDLGRHAQPRFGLDLSSVRVIAPPLIRYSVYCYFQAERLAHGDLSDCRSHGALFNFILYRCSFCS
jgi:hypothetical protein